MGRSKKGGREWEGEGKVKRIKEQRKDGGVEGVEEP